MTNAEDTRREIDGAPGVEARLPKGVMEAPTLTSLLEKEIARAKRYNQPFSALSFSVVEVVPKSTGLAGKIPHHRFLAALFKGISKVVRSADIIGELGKSRIIVLLPMTAGEHAQMVLKRCLKTLHAKPVNVDGIPLEIRLAGVSVVYDPIHTPDAGSFVKILNDELGQLEKLTGNK